MKIPPASEAKDASVKAKKDIEQAIRDKYITDRKKEQDEIEDDAREIINQVLEVLTNDIASKPGSGKTELCYNFPCAHKEVMYSKKIKDFIETLKKSGYTVSTRSFDQRTSERDIDYCYIREITIRW